MKKMMTAGLLALALVLTSQQQASAWVNFKAGIGLNWEWQSGGNSFLWGAVHGAQPPGPAYFGSAPVHHGFQPAYAEPPQAHYGHHQNHYVAPPAHPHQQPPNWTPPNPQPNGGTASPTPPVYPAAYYYPASYQPSSYYSNPYYYPAYWYGR